MINFQRKRLIDSMIRKAVAEQINEVGMDNPEHVMALRACRYDISRGVSDRILDDVARERRITKLFAQPKNK